MTAHEAACAAQSSLTVRRSANERLKQEREEEELAAGEDDDDDSHSRTCSDQVQPEHSLVTHCSPLHHTLAPERVAAALIASPDALHLGPRPPSPASPRGRFETAQHSRKAATRPATRCVTPLLPSPLAQSRARQHRPGVSQLAPDEDSCKGRCACEGSRWSLHAA